MGIIYTILKIYKGMEKTKLDISGNQKKKINKKNWNFFL